MSPVFSTSNTYNVVDLTLDSPSPPPQERRNSFNAVEPPTKRRRVENGQSLPTPSAAPAAVRAFLSKYVLPHLAEETGKLSRDRFRVDDIAHKVAEETARDPLVQKWLQNSLNCLHKTQQKILAQIIGRLVEKFCSQPVYQIPPPESTLPNSIKPHAELPIKTELTTQVGQDDTPTHLPMQQPPPAAAMRHRPLPRPTPSLRKRTRPRLDHRPYRLASERNEIRKGAKHFIEDPGDALAMPAVYHVDFTAHEISRLLRIVNPFFPAKQAPRNLTELARHCDKYHIHELVAGGIPGRSKQDIWNLREDLISGCYESPDNAHVLSLERPNEAQSARNRREGKVTSLLLAREMEGNRGFGRTRTLFNFQNEIRKSREDDFTPIAEFTNCAGDIATISWVDGNLICGTTEHSDSHNQQYNKPGNLLLYSSALSTLRAFSDHRVPRPFVEKGENSTDAMRQSQDPWLYSSVVSSDYDPISKRAFTSSFDKTVKVWEVDDEGRTMRLLATWKHDGNVNFVAAAKDGSGRVASAADVPSEAVRIYTVNPSDIENSPYQAFSCSRKDAGDVARWAYYPATLQWGKAPSTQHLLAVGYSPRSLSGDDADIPEDKTRSGEITIWDALVGRRIPVMTATTANVFEITWHPTLPRFLAATSPCGPSIEHSIRTQIHIFKASDARQKDHDKDEPAYCEYQSLDCSAADINELTFMPNSFQDAYVTAACTDGKVYVWDTAWGDDPLHVLEHGESLDGFHEHVETLDTGVKFTAWGRTADRLYTGASDGVVKVWNVRVKRKPFVRTLLEAPAPISCGAFSPDHSKLAIGDASGRLFMFSLDGRDEPETDYTKLPGLSRQVRRPKPVIPHPEPPPPPAYNQEPGTEKLQDGIAAYARQKYIDTRQLVSSGDPVIGYVQGPNYASSMHFRNEAHEDDDPTQPLLMDFDRQQRISLKWHIGTRRRSLLRLKEPSQPSERLTNMHQSNSNKELSVETINSADLAQMLQDKVILDVDDWEHMYEEMPVNTDSENQILLG